MIWSFNIINDDVIIIDVNIKQNSEQTDYTFSDINLVCSIENVFINNILKHGVTVTLQILVLSFWVRIPVLHPSKPGSVGLLRFRLKNSVVQ